MVGSLWGCGVDEAGSPSLLKTDGEVKADAGGSAKRGYARRADGFNLLRDCRKSRSLEKDNHMFRFPWPGQVKVWSTNAERRELIFIYQLRSPSALLLSPFPSCPSSCPAREPSSQQRSPKSSSGGRHALLLRISLMSMTDLANRALALHESLVPTPL